MSEVRLEMGLFQPPPDHCMQPTPWPDIKFGYADWAPIWGAADAGGYAPKERS